MGTGERIARIRRARGLTQRQLAESVGVTESALAHYEQGIRGVGRPQLEAIAGALGVPAATLTDFGIETAQDALAALLQMEESLGLTARASGGGVVLGVDPSAPGAPKVQAALDAWARMLGRLEAGEVTEAEYGEWRDSLAL